MSDENKDKGFGGRMRLTALENYKFGVSYYSAKDHKNDQGRFHSYGCDLELNFFETLKIEAEYVSNDFEKRNNRFSYYMRGTLSLGEFTPFVSVDFARDDANILYERGQARYSTGTGYALSDTVTLKAEYHYHKFNNKDRAPVLKFGTNDSNMYKASMIFVF